MGGLFSSEQPASSPQRQTTPSSTYHTRATYSSYRDDTSHPQTVRTVGSGSRVSYASACWSDDVTRSFTRLKIAGQGNSLYNDNANYGRTVEPLVKSVRNSSRFDIQSDDYFSASSVIQYIPLSEYDYEYQQITRKITNKRNFKVDKIERIENPYLKKAYELKKEQKKEIYPCAEEQWLFHGTPRANLDAICKYNFNWRLCKAHKYGKGISFSHNAMYASNYSDKYVHSKVMIVAKVLIGQSCIGNQFMELPDDGCDTSQKGMDAIVVVKYEDHEFLPIYKITYHLEGVSVNTGRRNQKRRQIFVPTYSFDDFNYFD